MFVVLYLNTYFIVLYQARKKGTLVSEAVVTQGKSATTGAADDIAASSDAGQNHQQQLLVNFVSCELITDLT